MPPGRRGADASPTATPRSSWASRSCRSSTRSTCPPPTRTASKRDRGHHRHRRRPTPSPCQRQDRPGRRRYPGSGWSNASRRRKGDPDAPLQALIIDSWFDNYVGVVSLVRVVNGALQHGREDPDDVDRRSPSGRQARRLHAASRCRASAQRRRGGLHHRRHQGAARRAKVGDTITLDADNAGRDEPLPGFKEIQPQVFAGLFPIEADEYDAAARRAREAEAQRLARCTTSRKCPPALGFGFRCGFLGLLHMEIVQERLEREFDLDLITTAPTRDLRGRADATAP